MDIMRQFVETWETGGLKTVSYYLRGELYEKFSYDRDGHCISIEWNCEGDLND